MACLKAKINKQTIRQLVAWTWTSCEISSKTSAWDACGGNTQSNLNSYLLFVPLRHAAMLYTTISTSAICLHLKNWQQSTRW